MSLYTVRRPIGDCVCQHPTYNGSFVVTKLSCHVDSLLALMDSPRLKMLYISTGDEGHCSEYDGGPGRCRKKLEYPAKLDDTDPQGLESPKAHTHTQE